MRESDGTDRELDIVLAILQLVQQRVAAVTPDAARDVEQEVRARYGGMRTRIAKRKKHLTPEERDKIVTEALSDAAAGITTDDLAQAGGISRRTLYRYLKRPAG